jgi:hypothetical protein
VFALAIPSRREFGDFTGSEIAADRPHEAVRRAVCHAINAMPTTLLTDRDKGIGSTGIAPGQNHANASKISEARCAVLTSMTIATAKGIMS